MRKIRPRRNLGGDRPTDVQQVIDDDPVTVAVYRHSNSFKAASTRTLVATFEGRIERVRDERDVTRPGDVGEVAETRWILLALYGVDRLGRAVAFEHGDEIEAGGAEYLVFARVPFPGIKNEGILVMKT